MPCLPPLQKQRNAKDFEGKKSHCMECDQKFGCQICSSFKVRSSFPSSQIYHHTRNLTLRCKSCRVCRLCKRTRNAKDFGNGIEKHHCTKCTKEIRVEEDIQCVICKHTGAPSTFSTKTLARFKRGHSAVCGACEKRGFSTLDVQSYRCTHGCIVGHLLCNRDQLKNQKSPQKNADVSEMQHPRKPDSFKK